MHCTAGPAMLTHPAFSQTGSPPSGIQQTTLGAVRLTCVSSLLDHPICPVGQGSACLLSSLVSVIRSVLASKPLVVVTQLIDELRSWPETLDYARKCANPGNQVGSPSCYCLVFAKFAYVQLGYYGYLYPSSVPPPDLLASSFLLLLGGYLPATLPWTLPDLQNFLLNLTCHWSLCLSSSFALFLLALIPCGSRKGHTTRTVI